MVILKRFICFFINFAFAIILLLIAEVIIAFIKNYLGLYSPSFLYGGDQTQASRAYMVVLPIMIALFDSRLMAKGFLGGRLTKCEIISPKSPVLSFLGCYLRTVFFFFPMFIYPGGIAMYEFSPNSFYEFIREPLWSMTSFFVIIIFPISVAVGNGIQGIHDYIFQTGFKRKRDKLNLNVNVGKKIVLSITISIIASMFMHKCLTNTSAYKSLNFYYSNLTEYMPSNIPSNLSSYYSDVSESHSSDRISYNEIAEHLNEWLKKSYLFSFGHNQPYISVGYRSDYGGLEIDITSNLNLENTPLVYEIAHTVANIVAEYKGLNSHLDKYKIKLSNRYVFDLIAYERSVLLNVRLAGNGFLIGIDIDKHKFGRGFPIGLPRNSYF